MQKNQIIACIVFIVVLVGVLTLFALNNEKKIESANNTEVVETVESVTEESSDVIEAPVTNVENEEVG